MLEDQSIGIGLQNSLGISSIKLVSFWPIKITNLAEESCFNGEGISRRGGTRMLNIERGEYNNFLVDILSSANMDSLEDVDSVLFI